MIYDSVLVSFFLGTIITFSISFDYYLEWFCYQTVLEPFAKTCPLVLPEFALRCHKFMGFGVLWSRFQYTQRQLKKTYASFHTRYFRFYHVYFTTENDIVYIVRRCRQNKRRSFSDVVQAVFGHHTHEPIMQTTACRMHSLAFACFKNKKKLIPLQQIELYLLVITVIYFTSVMHNQIRYIASDISHILVVLVVVYFWCITKN